MGFRGVVTDVTKRYKRNKCTLWFVYYILKTLDLFQYISYSTPYSSIRALSYKVLNLKQRSDQMPVTFTLRRLYIDEL